MTAGLGVESQSVNRTICRILDVSNGQYVQFLICREGQSVEFLICQKGQSVEFLMSRKG